MQIVCSLLQSLFNSFDWSPKKGHRRLDQGRKLPTSGTVSTTLSSRNPGNFLKSVPTESQEEGVATATEPVLRGLEDSATFKVLVLCLYGEVHHGINHVLKLVSTSHLSRLVNLSDDDSVTVVFLAVVSNHSQCTFSTLAIGVTILVEAIIKTLKAVDNHEEWLTWISFAKLICILKKGRNVIFLTSDKAVTELKSFTNQLDLEEAFLSSIKNTYRTRLGELVSQGKHHGSLTRTRLTGEECYCGRGESITAQSAINVAKARLMLVPKLLRHLEVKNVSSKSYIVSYIKLHLISFSLVKGCLVNVVAFSIPHQHIYYTTGEDVLHESVRIMQLSLRQFLQHPEHQPFASAQPSTTRSRLWWSDIQPP